jgi:hypothetical protein
VKQTAHVQESLDRVAIGLSGLCALHCLVMPICIVVFPIVATSFGSDERFHFGLALLVLPSSALALVLGCRSHRDAAVLGLGVLGLVALLLLAWRGHAFVGEAWERVATAGASAVVALAHVRNYRLCRRDACDG